LALTFSLGVNREKFDSFRTELHNLSKATAIKELDL